MLLDLAWREAVHPCKRGRSVRKGRSQWRPVADGVTSALGRHEPFDNECTASHPNREEGCAQHILPCRGYSTGIFPTIGRRPSLVAEIHPRYLGEERTRSSTSGIDQVFLRRPSP